MNRETPAVLLDKDGTLVENLAYNVNPARIRLLPGVSEGLRILKGAGYKLVVVSNQSGVARGRFTEEELLAAADALECLLSSADAALDGFFYCPHHPEGIVAPYALECTCRKPRPGLIQRAASELNLMLERSWMVGDILDDIEAGNRAGCRTVLIDQGNETEWYFAPDRVPDRVTDSFLEAANYIVNVSRSGAPSTLYEV